MRNPSRREFLVGGTALAAAGIAGCSGGGSTDAEPTPTESGAASSDATATEAPARGTGGGEPSGREATEPDEERSPTTEPDLAPVRIEHAWPSVSFDAANTGAVDWSGPEAGVEKRWQRTLSNDGFAPLLIDGSVLVADEDGEIASFDAATGAREWAFNDDRLTNGPFAYQDGFLCCQADRNVASFDASSQSRAWKIDYGRTAFDPAGANGEFYAVGKRYGITGKLRVLDPESGTRKLELELEQTANTRPAVRNRTAFVGTESGVEALDVDAETTRWTATTDQTVIGAPTVTDHGVYALSDGKRLYRFDRNTGERLWKAPVKDNWSFGCAVTDETVVASDGTALYGFSVADGTEKWRYATDDKDRGTDAAPVIGNGVVYATLGASTLHAVDVESGDAVWTHMPGGEGSIGSITTPVVVDGLLFTTFNDELVALQEPA